MSSFLFSCENATCAVPGEHTSLFSGHEEVLSCAQGWEPGALNLAQACAMRFRTPLVHAETSCLLLDVEEARDHCWSRFTDPLNDQEKRQLLERYWESYRSHLHRRIRGDIDRHGYVLHVMIHTDPQQREHVLINTPHKLGLAAGVAEKWVSSMKREDLRCRHEVIARHSHLSCELADSYESSQYAQLRLSVHQDFFLTGLPWSWATIKNHLLDTLAIAANEAASLTHR